MKISEFPFKILAMAPFQPAGDIFWNGDPVMVPFSDMDAAMLSMGVSAYIHLPADLCPAGGLELRFERLKDFHPDALVQNTPFLNHVLEAKQFLTGADVKKLSEGEVRTVMDKWSDLPEIKLPSLPKKARENRTADDKPNSIDKILNMVALPGETEAPMRRDSAGPDQVDGIIQQILNHIFGDKRFSAAEAAWRGLKLLLQQGADDAGRVELEIVPVTLQTLEETVNRLAPYLINNLPSLVIIDLPFDNSPVCTELLEKVADLSETLMVPSLVQISSEFMQVNSWKDAEKLAFIPHHMEQPAYAKWQTLKNKSSATWLAATCNRFLVRYPYGRDNRLRTILFDETPLLWIGPVWAQAAMIAQSQVKFGWPTRLTNFQQIKIENLALQADALSNEIPVEILFGEDRHDQMIRAGIMPLAAMPNKDIVFTPGETNISGTSFAYQLLLSRITQFIFWCKASFQEDLAGAQLESRMKQAFTLFWEKSGHILPDENINIAAGETNPDGKVPLHIDLQPPADILPRSAKIEMDFFW